MFPRMRVILLALLLGCSRPAPPKTAPDDCPPRATRHETALGGGTVTYCLDRKGEPDGPWIERWANGRKRRQARLQGGQYHGLVRTWYEEGQPETAAHWRRDRLHGRTIAWYASGQKREEGDYEHGNRVGAWDLLNENGKLVARVEHDPVRRMEGTTLFDALGQRVRYFEFWDGWKHGRWTTYDKSGDPDREEWWVRDTLVEKRKYEEGRQVSRLRPRP
jgi:antitoxin component YwqK of YwqJK toxin-antitoxin module